MNEYKKLKNEIIKEFFKDKEYVKFLCDQDLADIFMIDMICAAPISLTRKAKMLKRLSKYQTCNEDVYFSYKTYYEEIINALEALTLKDDEIFLCVVKTREHGEETVLEYFPSKSLEEVYKIVNEEIEEDKDFCTDCDIWYQLEKWRPISEKNCKSDNCIRGDMKQGFTYTFLNGEICYFDGFREKVNYKERRIKEKFNLFYSGISFNLPTPWKEGDILEIESTPFTPETRVVVLETSDFCDCCFPYCLYLTERGIGVGALKHSHIYKKTPHKNISPLFLAKKFTGELTADEMVLKNVADYVKGDRERGNKIYNLVTQEPNGDADARHEAMRKLKLIKFILRAQKNEEN